MDQPLPALDEAYHQATRKPAALAGSYAFLALLLLLVHTGVLPVPKARMTATILAFGLMVFLTTLTFHRWGFRSLRYRVMLLLETLTLLSGLALSMVGAPPGLPLLWAFYLLLCVITAQDVGASRIALGVVLTPVLALFVYQAAIEGFADLRQYAYTTSGGLLAGVLFLCKRSRGNGSLRRVKRFDVIKAL